MASSWDNNSDCGSEISRATSDITAEPTGHAQQRIAEREIEQRDFQAAETRHQERHHTHADRWVFKHNGSVFVKRDLGHIDHVPRPRGRRRYSRSRQGTATPWRRSSRTSSMPRAARCWSALPKAPRALRRGLDYRGRGHAKLTDLRGGCPASSWSTTPRRSSDPPRRAPSPPPADGARRGAGGLRPRHRPSRRHQ